MACVRASLPRPSAAAARSSPKALPTAATAARATASYARNLEYDNAERNFAEKTVDTYPFIDRNGAVCKQYSTTAVSHTFDAENRMLNTVSTPSTTKPLGLCGSGMETTPGAARGEAYGWGPADHPLTGLTNQYFANAIGVPPDE